MRLVLPKLHPGQQQIFDHPARYKVVAAGRRWRKSSLGATVAVDRMAQGLRGFWTAPTYPLTSATWRIVRGLVEQIPGRVIHDADMRLELPTGGRMQFRSTKDPDSLRSEGLDFLIMDESAYSPERAWQEVLRPALIDRQGEAWFLSTPAGYNWFAEKFNQKLTGWASWQKPTWDNPHIAKEEIELARLDMTELAFLQEIEAKFVDVGAGRFNTEWFRYFEIRSIDGQRWYLVGGKRYRDIDCTRYVVIDPAVSVRETADFSAIGAIAQTPDGDTLVLDVIRRRIEGPDIIPTVERLMRKWDCTVVHIETVAFQLALFQEAKRRGLAAKKLKADRDKASRAMPLEVKLRNGQVYFNEEGGWVRELERELIMFTGDPKTDVHDDQVDMLAYAVIAGQKSKIEWVAV